MFPLLEHIQALRVDGLPEHVDGITAISMKKNNVEEAIARIHAQVGAISGKRPEISKDELLEAVLSIDLFPWHRDNDTPTLR